MKEARADLKTVVVVHGLHGTFDLVHLAATKYIRRPWYQRWIGERLCTTGTQPTQAYDGPPTCTKCLTIAHKHGLSYPETNNDA